MEAVRYATGEGGAQSAVNGRRGCGAIGNRAHQLCADNEADGDLPARFFFCPRQTDEKSGRRLNPTAATAAKTT